MKHIPSKRPPTRTAQALALVQQGMTVRKAAAQCNVSPQAVYRLMHYRRENPACPMCGR